MISESAFEHITRGLGADDAGALRETAEDVLARKPEIPEELREAEVFGPYRLAGAAGRGGMGEVVKAWDAELGRWVALKLLRRASASLRVRFSRESFRLARLAHPNIVPVFRSSQHGETPYIAMAWIEGRTLDTVEMSVRQGLEAVRTAARAIEFAHQRGIVHRDLKPQNVMITEGGHIYVLDFGLAREAGEEVGTVAGAVLGTPAYMAPEQARGQTDAIGPCTDVYGLGTTLYHLVTGRPPFAADDVPALMLKIAGEEPPRPRSLRRNLHPDIEMIVQTAMEKAPKDRYASAGALADDIDRFLEGEPILARAAPWWRRAGRWMDRNPYLSASLLTAVPLLVAMAMAWGLTLYYFRERIEAQEDLLRLRESRMAELEALTHFRRAQEEGRAGRWEGALKEINLAILWDRYVKEFHLSKAEILDALGRSPEAQTARDEAAKLVR